MRSVRVYRYAVDGERAAGVLATDLPPQYARRATPDGDLSVDYNALLARGRRRPPARVAPAELWGCVRHQAARIDALEAAVQDKQRPDDDANVAPRTVQPGFLER